MPPIVLTVSW